MLRLCRATAGPPPLGFGFGLGGRSQPCDKGDMCDERVPQCAPRCVPVGALSACAGKHTGSRRHTMDGLVRRGGEGGRGHCCPPPLLILIPSLLPLLSPCPPLLVHPQAWVPLQGRCLRPPPQTRQTRCSRLACTHDMRRA